MHTPALRHSPANTRIRSLGRAVPAALALVLAPAALRAQGMPIPLDDPAVRRAMEAMRPLHAWTLDQQVSICEIPAPPFWGRRVTQAREVPFAAMFAGMDLKTLYRLHWGSRGSGP